MILSPSNFRPPPRRRGIAMILVMSVVLIVSVMTAGMIASSAVRAHIGPDMADRAKAAALADSGIDIAAYYMENPMLAPSLGADGYWTGAPSMSLGDGTVSITVAGLGSNIYQVASVGKITRGSSVIQQTSTSRMKVHSYFAATNAISSNALSTFIPTSGSVTGPVMSTGPILNRGRIIGNVKATGFTNLGIQDPGYTYTIGVFPSAAPSAANLKDYSSYVYNGVTYSAKTITTTTAGATLGPTADNPMGIFRCAGNLTLSNNVTINGTLIVEGTLNLNGNANITSQKNYPALIVKGDAITRSTTSRTLSVNGLSWMGGSLKSALLTQQNINFHGPVLFGGVGSVDSSYTGTLNVWQETSSIGQMQLDSSAATPSVTFLKYEN